MQGPPDGDTLLMVRAARGDDAAFDALVGSWHPRVCHYAARMLGRRDEAEDVAQEVFLRIYRARERYRPEARFSTYLFHVAGNVCRNRIRDRRPAGLALDETRLPSSGEAAGAGLERQEVARAVREAVAALPENQRSALILNKFHDMGYAEVAQAMGLSVAAVRSLLTRARLGVKARLAPWVAEGTRSP